MTPKHPVTVYHGNSTKRIPSGKIRELSNQIYSGERISLLRSTNLICCTDYRIRRLNRAYRNIDRATDVLSFPFDDEDFLGEIYISLRRTEVQSRRFAHSFNDEFCRLFVHGMLHLAGYDHSKKRDQMEMNRKENHYLQKNVY